MKLTKLIALTVFLFASASYAANPVTKAYVDAQDQKLQAQINSSGGSSGNSGRYIGEYYQGGVIYWLDGSTTPPNQHGLIVDIADKPRGAWSSVNTTTNAILTGAYQGKNNATACNGAACNTAKILATPGATYPAASACATSTSQGYTDWYLPSSYELQLLYVTQMIITSTALANGGGAFDTRTYCLYWSSTEYNPSSAAWRYDFCDGRMDWTTKTNPNNSVRCIRAF